MSKVFVVQDNGRYNLLAAQKYGDLITLLPARMQIQLDATEAIEAISNKLIHYNSEDSILAIGDPAAIGIAIAVATFYNGGIINVLKFDRHQNDYYRLPVDLTQFFEQEAA